MGIFDRRVNKAADGILRRIEAEEKNKGEFGNPIVVWIVGAVLQIVIKKLLERIIENDGEDVKNLAASLLAKMEEEDDE